MRPSMTPDLGVLRPIAAELSPMIDAFVEGGFELHVVGGLVRDLVGDRSVDLADIDLATDARPDEVRAVLRGRVDSLWRQGERFGTIGVTVGDRKIEITTYRAEVYHPDSRKPSVRFSTDLATDLSRRDFTINAMAATLPGLRLVDPFDGMADLRQRVLRTPLDPAISFDDDPLRMLRGARFLATLDLVPVDGLITAMAQRVDRLRIVSAERIGDELLKLLAVESPGRGLVVLDQAGLLEVVVPEYAGTGRPHRTVDAAMTDGIAPADPLWRLAAIYAFLEPGAVGPAAARLRLPREDRRRCGALTEAIALCSGLDGVDLPTSRRLAALLGDDRDHLAGVMRARAEAVAGHGGEPEAARLRTAATAVETGWIELGDEDLADLGPGLSGEQVMEELDLEPGPAVGRALEWLARVRIEEGVWSEARLRAGLQAWWGRAGSGQ